MIERHLPLVRHLARRLAGMAWNWSGGGEGSGDLVQSGSIGLIKAIDGFDHRRGVKFSTYAVPFIMGEMRRFLRGDRLFRPGEKPRSLARDARDVRDRLAQELQREPTVGEIARELGVDTARLVSAMEMDRSVVSLFRPPRGREGGKGDSGGLPLIHRLRASAGSESGTAAMDATLAKIRVEELLSRLPPLQRQVIMLRYLADCTQAETARRLELSQGYVSRLEKAALAAMKDAEEAGAG